MFHRRARERSGQAEGHRSVASIAFRQTAADNGELWLGTERGRIEVHDFGSGQQLGEVDAHHHNRVAAIVTWAKRVWTASTDSTIHVYRAAERTREHVLRTAGPVTSLLRQDRDDGTPVVWAVSGAGCITAWDARAAAPLHKFEIAAAEGRQITRMLLRGQELWCATERAVFIVDAASGSLVSLLPADMDSKDATEYVLPDSPSEEDAMSDWCVITSEGIEAEAPEASLGEVFAQDGGSERRSSVSKPSVYASCLVAVTDTEVWSASRLTGCVQVWNADAKDMERQWLVDCSGFNELLCLEDMVWAGANNGSVYVWHGPSHTPLHEMSGHSDQITCLCPVLGSQFVVSASGQCDGSIVTWLTSDSEEDRGSKTDQRDRAVYDRYGFLRFQRCFGDDPVNPGTGFKDVVVQTEEHSKHIRAWDTYMERSGNVFTKSPESQALVRGGIPAKYRKVVWPQMITVLIKDTKRFIGEDFYDTVLRYKAGKVSPSWKQINLDLLRTFPSNRYFQDKESPPVKAMSRVLVAFSWHNPRVGYCQGLNRVAGFSLFSLEEQDAFWCLMAIVEVLMTSEYYVDPLIVSRADQEILHDLVELELPTLAEHLREFEYQLEVTTFNWLFAIFVGSLPVDVVLHIWDSFLNEGQAVLFRFALALLKFHEPHILESIVQLSDKIKIFNYMKRTIKRTRDIDRLAKIAFEELSAELPARLQRLKEKHVAQARKEHEQLTKKIKAEQLLADVSPAAGPPE